MKFKEVKTKNLNNGWTMGAGVVVGVGASLAVGAALTQKIILNLLFYISSERVISMKFEEVKTKEVNASGTDLAISLATGVAIGAVAVAT